MGTVLVIARLVDVLRLIEDGRRSGQEPIARIMHVDIRGRTLEIVYIRRSYLAHIVRMARYQVRELAAQREGRRCGSRDPWDLVDRVG